MLHSLNYFYPHSFFFFSVPKLFWSLSQDSENADHATLHCVQSSSVEEKDDALCPHLPAEAAREWSRMGAMRFLYVSWEACPGCTPHTSYDAGLP